MHSLQLQKQVPLYVSTGGGVEYSDSNMGSINQDNVETSKMQGKEKRNKHCCKFCMKLVANFSLHIVKLHPSEKEVLKI